MNEAAAADGGAVVCRLVRRVAVAGGDAFGGGGNRGSTGASAAGRHGPCAAIRLADEAGPSAEGAVVAVVHAGQDLREASGAESGGELGPEERRVAQALRAPRRRREETPFPDVHEEGLSGVHFRGAHGAGALSVVVVKWERRLLRRRAVRAGNSFERRAASTCSKSPRDSGIDRRPDGDFWPQKFLRGAVLALLRPPRVAGPEAFAVPSGVASVVQRRRRSDAGVAQIQVGPHRQEGRPQVRRRLRSRHVAQDDDDDLLDRQAPERDVALARHARRSVDAGGSRDEDQVSDVDLTGGPRRLLPLQEVRGTQMRPPRSHLPTVRGGTGVVLRSQIRLTSLGRDYLPRPLPPLPLKTRLPESRLETLQPRRHRRPVQAHQNAPGSRVQRHAARVQERLSLRLSPLHGLTRLLRRGTLPRPLLRRGRRRPGPRKDRRVPKEEGGGEISAPPKRPGGETSSSKKTTTTTASSREEREFAPPRFFSRRREKSPKPPPQRRSGREASDGDAELASERTVLVSADLAVPGIDRGDGRVARPAESDGAPREDPSRLRLALAGRDPRRTRPPLRGRNQHERLSHGNPPARRRLRESLLRRRLRPGLPHPRRRRRLPAENGVRRRTRGRRRQFLRRRRTPTS
mmetsp:Transcript_30300/g.97670  ORF Transcript_30300/g.97670 Transcript_30300/m.97670 type:complete len:633 (-) Transcript_30300:396-2294(-)